MNVAKVRQQQQMMVYSTMPQQLGEEYSSAFKQAIQALQKEETIAAGKNNQKPAYSQQILQVSTQAQHKETAPTFISIEQLNDQQGRNSANITPPSRSHAVKKSQNATSQLGTASQIHIGAASLVSPDHQNKQRDNDVYDVQNSNNNYGASLLNGICDVHLSNLSNSRGFANSKKPQSSRRVQQNEKKRCLMIQEPQSLEKVKRVDENDDENRNTPRNVRAVQSTLQQPEAGVQTFLSMKKKSHVLNSQKKSYRNKRNQIDQLQTNNNKKNNDLQQEEVPDLLETRQFTQSFMQKLMDSQEQDKKKKHHTSYLVSPRKDKKQKRLKTQGSVAPKNDEETQHHHHQVQANFQMREDTQLRQSQNINELKDLAIPDSNSKDASNMAPKTQLVEKVTRRQAGKQTKKVVLPVQQQTQQTRRSNLKSPNPQITQDQVVLVQQQLLQNSTFSAKRKLSGAIQENDDIEQSSTTNTNENYHSRQFKSKKNFSEQIKNDKNNHQNDSSFILPSLNMKNKENVVLQSQNNSQWHHEDSRNLTSTKKNNPQASRQLFQDIQVVQINQPQLNTCKKPYVAGATNFNKLSEEQQQQQQQILLVDKFSPSPHNQVLQNNNKRLALLAKEKQKELWNRNSQPPQLLQVRQIDSAGIVPDLIGTLPPVPQFSMASPEIGGHLGGGGPLNINSRQRTNLLDAGNQKRLTKLKPLGKINVPNIPTAAQSYNNRLASTNVIQSQSNPHILQLKQRTNSRQPAAIINQEDYEMRQASYNLCHSQENKQEQGMVMNDEDLVSDGISVTSRLNSLNVIISTNTSQQQQQQQYGAMLDENYIVGSGHPSETEGSTAGGQPSERVNSYRRIVSEINDKEQTKIPVAGFQHRQSQQQMPHNSVDPATQTSKFGGGNQMLRNSDDQIEEDQPPLSATYNIKKVVINQQVAPRSENLSNRSQQTQKQVPVMLPTLNRSIKDRPDPSLSENYLNGHNQAGQQQQIYPEANKSIQHPASIDGQEKSSPLPSSLIINTPKSTHTSKAANLIKCEDQSNHNQHQQQQIAILSNLNSLKRRKIGGGQRLKPLSPSGGSELPLAAKPKLSGDISNPLSSHNNIQSFKPHVSNKKKRAGAAEQSQAQKLQNNSNNTNSLIESEAKPECFNFTFNPKDDGEQEDQYLQVNGNALDTLKLIKHQSTGLKSSNGQDFVEKNSSFNYQQSEYIVKAISSPVKSGNHSASKKNRSKPSEISRQNSNNTNKKVTRGGNPDSQAAVNVMNSPPCKKSFETLQASAHELSGIVVNIGSNSSQQQSTQQGSTTSPIADKVTTSQKRLNQHNQQHNSQFMSPQQQEPLGRKSGPNHLVALASDDVDPFNETMSGQIVNSDEPAAIFNNLGDDIMQDAIDNIDLNPPPEFLDALSWDKPSQGSGSVMKFSVPLPPLTSEQKQYQQSTFQRQGSEIDKWRYKNSPSVQDIVVQQQHQQQFQLKHQQSSPQAKIQPFRIGQNRRNNVNMISSATQQHTIQPSNNLTSSKQNALAQIGSIRIIGVANNDINKDPIVNRPSSIQKQQSYMQEFTPQFPVSHVGPLAGSNPQAGAQSGSTGNKKMLQSKKLMINSPDSTKYEPPKLEADYNTVGKGTQINSDNLNFQSAANQYLLHAQQRTNHPSGLDTCSKQRSSQGSL